MALSRGRGAEPKPGKRVCTTCVVKIKNPIVGSYPSPYSIRVTIDEARSLWVNFGVSKEHGFYTSLRIGEARTQE